MELGDSFRSVRKVLRGLPGAFVRSVALPMNEVLHSAMSDARVQDILHFPFHVVLQLHGRRWRLYSTRETVLPMGFQERYVEYRVDAHLWG